ncbi:MAG TPA: hypothetical protein VFX20_07875 [Steroidobacteraceae bacterium]|nr:hypothetical protein [Steroidobacteraceae bacterium]
MEFSCRRGLTARFHRLARGGVLFTLAMGASAIAAATSTTAAVIQQSLDDAWWTGPLLAASPGTLPKGHWLFEPYFFDVMSYGHFDRYGTLRSAGASHEIGNQSYVEYGLIDGFTLGLIPRLGFHESAAGQASSGFAVGDITLQGSYGLTQFRPGSWIPTTSLVIGETFPTGKYDRLSGPTDGALGSGAYSTTLSLYSQTYFWMPNGRILRTRLDLSYQVSRWASVQGISVYGTGAGFEGRAHPGPSFIGDLAFEYSATQNWVLAADLWWEHDGNTRVQGSYTPPGGASLASAFSVLDSGSGELLYLAPAIEYNWNARMGVIAGARIAAAGRNTTATATPVAAINMVF